VTEARAPLSMKMNSEGMVQQSDVFEASQKLSEVITEAMTREL
jgi:hypothetical protein